MAEIFLACDLGPTGIGRFLAIKKALSHFSENEEFIDMFKNEGKVACNLKHGNIAPIYEFGFESNQLYLSMEYISGRNLRELIKKTITSKTPIDAPYSVYMIKEVAAGLNYAHNAVDSSTGQPLHLIHRDISPQNIMVSFDGEVKIIDFGIAKIADTDLTKAGHLKGKFGYMSPEQARGEKLDLRGDVFCLGTILWELLANKRLFKCENEMATLRKVQNCDIPGVQNINPQVSSSLEKIVLKALKKNKNSRYNTALEFERDLNRLLSKKYPNFDRYDFSAFIKKIYARDILNERELLKKYSKQFKEYMKMCYEKELSYETNIDELMAKEDKGFSVSEASVSVAKSGAGSAAASSTLPITHTKTIQDDSTNEPIFTQSHHHSQSQNNRPLTATEKYDKSLLTETIGRTKKSLSRTNPPLELMDTIIKKETSQLSELMQQSHSYTVPSLSTSHPQSQGIHKKFLPSTWKRLTPLVYIGLFAGLCASAVWSVKYIKARMSVSEEPLTLISKKAPHAKPVVPSPEGSKTKPAPKETKRKQQRSAASLSKPSYQTERAAYNHKAVFVKTRPSGAMVFVNDRFTIRTPNILKIKQIKGETLKIRIEKKGYKTVHVPRSEMGKTEISIILKRLDSSY